MSYVPVVIEQTNLGERSYDIYSRLLKDRIIMLNDEVTDATASMGSFLLAAGAKGKRYALPNSEILIHQPSVYGGFQGQATDIKIHTEWLLRTKSKLNKIYSERTGKPIEIIERDMERDYFMSAEEAMSYGIIDKILLK
jgi:ATP-dependent Clp protease protease subunit